MRISILPSICLAVSLLATSPSNGLAQTVSRVVPIKNIRFKICGESSNWKRPTFEQQKRHLLELHRYGSKLNEIEAILRTDEYWNKDIFAFTTYPGGSGTYEVEQLSGLWTPIDTLLPYRCDKRHVADLNDGKIAEVWTLNYKIVSVGWSGTQYILRVKRISKGTQNIHFPRREHLEKLPLTVVDQNGQAVSVAFQ